MKFMKNKKIIFIAVLILIIIFSIILIINSKNNLNTLNNVKLYYRTYTKEKGWSSWSKNGEVSGNLNYDILNIEFKLKTKEKGNVIYRVYDENWNESNNINTKIKNEEIKALRMSLTDTLDKKYIIYYKTYNKADKWLDYSFDGIINGNANEVIKGIKIKIIPKNVVEDEWLEDYNDEKMNVGF